MSRHYPVSISCEVLEVSASGYFNWLRQRHSSCSGPSGRYSNEALLTHIRTIHAEVKGEYGWPRMHKELVARGIRVVYRNRSRYFKQISHHEDEARCCVRRWWGCHEGRYWAQLAREVNFSGPTRACHQS